MQSSQAITAPRTHEDLMSLIARRDELQMQLQSLSDSRAHLAQQITDIGSSNPAVVQEPVARLKAMDAEIKRVDASLRSANEMIEGAKAKGLWNDQTIPGPAIVNIPPPPSIPDYNINVSTDSPWQERLGQMLTTTLPITAGAVILLGAFLYWRISRSMRNQLAQMLASQSVRLEELQRSIDTVAVEVERVTENQRFVTKLVGDKSATQPLR